ncbi:hypothetical protein [Mucilaginibacter sp. UR6-11]|uniref:hypothetical protein n=1 Tax=Mucilaginibacter sp. UR6-11 TaxID=1435644 RepID=UPI001E62E826|nr:hypothetical protein [Mucilaginibacter sp. UR6-11]MCC8426136.1 hypothetical protein [Mucilaginibacter sp. UR6-11]
MLITSSQLFSYNITEVDTVTNDFYVKDDYDVASLNYTFTPQVGHKIILEATTRPNADITAAVTYKDKIPGPVNIAKYTDRIDVSFTYVVPK